MKRRTHLLPLPAVLGSVHLEATDDELLLLRVDGKQRHRLVGHARPAADEVQRSESVLE